MLEEGSFRGRTADFVFMFVFGGVLMIVSFPSSETSGRGASVPILCWPWDQTASDQGGTASFTPA